MTLATLQLGMHWFPERYGGLDRFYHGLTHALPHAGIGVTGLVAGSSRCEAETAGAIRAFAPADAPLHEKWRRMNRMFTGCVRSGKPDVLVSHFPLYTVPVIDRLGGLPLVVHFQGPWADEGALEGNSRLRVAVKRGIERLVYAKAAHAVVLSQAFAEILAGTYRFPRSRIHVIPGGVDTARFAAAASRAPARARLGWPEGRPILLAVRRLAPRMGLENLLEATAIMRKSLPDILVLIAGRGRLLDALAARAEALGLSDHVWLLGYLPDEALPCAYRAADLSILPSLALEGFGLAAAESLAAGTPCLVAPVGGLPELAGGLCKNLILASAAPADIAAGVIQALRGALALPDATACATYAAQNFDWRIVARRVAGVYARAAA